MTMLKKWKVKDEFGDKAETLAKDLGVSRLLAGILINRGIDTKEKGDLFLHPEKIEYCDPYLLPDMDLAAERIVRAIKDQEKIVIYGDYDADGITATSLLLRVLRQLGGQVDYYIPNRFSEGYGLNPAALDMLADKGTQLIITVDCGVKSVEDIRNIKDRLDVVVTDHHLPGDELPPAIAVVDAHRTDSGYPCPELAGVGVAFKLCQVLWQKIKNEPLGNRGIELAALGTVADAVPLTGENRRIVSTGLKIMENTSILGIRALIEVSGSAGKAITSTTVGFYLAPRINAAGRLKSAELGVELLTCEDEARAAVLAAELNTINDERRKLKDDMQLEAEDQLAQMDVDNTRVLVVVGENWHQGVLGLVASSIETKYYRPVIVISVSEGMGKGSCRSIPGFNLYEALENCEEVLEQFGGHEGAAGLTVRPENIPRLRELLEKEARRQMVPEQFIPFFELDQEISPLEITMEMAEELNLLQPCGMKNEGPLFGCRGVRGALASNFGTDNRHTRFSVVDGPNRSVGAVAFNMSVSPERIDSQPLDMVYELNINEWNGDRQLQCLIRSLDTPLADEGTVTVDRDFLKELYLFLRECSEAGKRVLEDAAWLSMRMRLSGRQASAQAVANGLKIFTELGLLVIDEAGSCALVAGTGKMNLQDSATFRQLQG